MELNVSSLRKRHHAVSNGSSIQPKASPSSPPASNGHHLPPPSPPSQHQRQQQQQQQTVWGKTDDGTVFKVPTTHDVLTLFNPTYPKSHFDILSLFLLGSQVALFLLFLFLHRLHPHSHFQSFSKGFFVVYFAFWRTAYDLGLGWVLTKQSKRKWIVRLVRGRGWLDTDRRPAVREWIRRQLEGKMGRDYKFDDLPLEYNTWLLFRQVVDIILLNDFVSYNLFALSTLDILFPAPNLPLSPPKYTMLAIRLAGGFSLLLFNLWVKTSAHDVVKDYGWYWGDCFFSRGYLRKTPVTPSTQSKDSSSKKQRENNGTHKDETAELQFDLTFTGIFEMAPHPMYSVGYAGYYGVSLLAFSYQVFFVSLAAHAAQFAFLNFFENPHIERRYGTRKPLAAREPIMLPPKPRSSSHSAAISRTGSGIGVGQAPTKYVPVLVEGEVQNPSAPSASIDGKRPRSVSLGTQTDETTAIDPEEAHDERNGIEILSSPQALASAEILANVTPPNGVQEVFQEAVTQHDLLNRFFRGDVVVLRGLDLLRAQDQLLLLATFYIVTFSVLPQLSLSSETFLYLHLAHALAWRMYYSFFLGLLLKAQSESKFLVRHFLEHYHYPTSIIPISGGKEFVDDSERGVKDGAVREAFENWKGCYNLGMVMCYLSFVGFAMQTYHLPVSWTVGDELLRHTVGTILIALHVWAARESYEVLGIFGWFFGDFFIDDYPSSLNYTGIYRFLNNPERTMSGAALFGIALITGNKSVFALAIFGHLAHWWFLSWVEEPHMKKLYGDALRKDAGLTKALKKLAKQNAKMFEGVREQLALLLDENSQASKQSPKLHEVAKSVVEVSEKIGEVYSEGSERVEDAWRKSRPRISEVLAETKTLIQQSRERFVIPLLARDLADYDQTKYAMYVVPTNPDGQLRFHWGEPITIVWRSPLRHSRRDWVGIYRYGANRSQTMTQTSSLGLWVPVHDEEWDGDVPRPHKDPHEGEETECGEIMFKNSTLPWQVGDYELRYHHDGKYNVVALVGPIQVYMDRPDGLDFHSIRLWLLKIVTLALDSDPELIPQSRISYSTNEASSCAHNLNSSSSSIATTTQANSGNSGSTSYNPYEDDFRFWSERQAKRISYAISLVLGIEFAQDVILADANVTALTRRILASKELLGA